MARKKPIRKVAGKGVIIGNDGASQIVPLAFDLTGAYRKSEDHEGEL